MKDRVYRRGLQEVFITTLFYRHKRVRPYGANVVPAVDTAPDKTAHVHHALTSEELASGISCRTTSIHIIHITTNLVRYSFGRQT